LSYWSVPETILANIKGEVRRRAIQQATEEGKLDRLPAILLGDDLPTALIEFLGSMHHKLLSGETLPSYLPGEVEIARVVYSDTVLGDVASFRARRDGDCIRYRAVDDNALELPCDAASTTPLTMAELIQLIEDTGEAFALWVIQMESGVQMPDLPAFYVQSEFYPRLRDHYAAESRRWRQEHIV
jgi:hypothetical protein